MVDFGKLAKKAKGLADQHGDKIAGAVNKATDLIDDKTKGKHADKLAKVDSLAAKLDKTADRSSREDPSATPERPVARPTDGPTGPAGPA